MQRVLFIFEVARAKAGKAQVLRLSLQHWLQEADISCLAGHILDEMSTRRNTDNLLLFQADTVTKLNKQFIEGTLACDGIDLLTCWKKTPTKQLLNLKIPKVPPISLEEVSHGITVHWPS